MPDQKISEDALITTFTMDMYIPIVDPNEALAEDRNKRVTLAMLFGRVTTFTDDYTYGDGGEFGPYIMVFKGTTTDKNLFLPAGATDIIGLPIWVVNLGTAGALDVYGGGSPAETINAGADPFNIPNGDKNAYCFRYTGSTDGWVVN